MVRQRFPNRKRKTGPKPVYIGRLPEVTRICKLFGPSNKKLAEYFEVSVQTIDYWVRHYPEFKNARDRGLAFADSYVVDSLYRRANGYPYEEKEYAVFTDEDGQQIKVLKKVTRKYMPSDVKACMFILSNRQREQWLTRMNVHHSGRVEHAHLNIEEIPVDQLSVQAQELLFEITKKQLTDGTRSN